jgi:hypothetical protein
MINHLIVKIKEDRQFNKYSLNAEYGDCWLKINNCIIFISKNTVIDINIKNYHYRNTWKEINYIKMGIKFDEIYVDAGGVHDSYTFLGENRTKFVLNEIK